jgi:V/A-type H+-transporting ATPase subunit I
VPLKFGSGEHYFAAFGWVPKAKVDDVKNAFAEESDLFIEVIAHDEEPPVELDNPALARPFEGVTKLMALPKYHEIDPSSIMLITFPLFFGLMLGDVAYGIVIFLFIKSGGMQKFCNFIGIGNIPPNSALSKILMYCAISSIGFGLIFGEFFGIELYHFISRIHYVEELLIISMTIGYIHMILGYLLGYANERTEGKSVMEAGLGKFSWIGITTAFYIILLALFGTIELGLGGMIGFVILIPSVILLVKAEGSTAAFEITMPLSNILSYTRLVAFGLSSIAIATVANIAFKGITQIDVMAIIIVILGVMMHILNTLLALLPMFLQSLRLHYVEFFIKFYEGGGESYKPLGGK